MHTANSQGPMTNAFHAKTLQFCHNDFATKNEVNADCLKKILHCLHMQVWISGFWRLYAAKIGNLLHVCLQLLALI